MSFSNDATNQIDSLIDLSVNSYLRKAKVHPTSGSNNPFVYALLKDFEPLLHNIHGLKTSLGGEIEKVAEIIAIEAWGKENVFRKVNRNVKLPRNVFQTIDTIINNLSNPSSKSNYFKEKQLVISACANPSRDYEQHKYEFDLELFDTSTKKRYFIEMKGPDPNTTEVPGAKKRLLTELAWGYFNKKQHNLDSLFAIYYNNQFPKRYSNAKVMYYFDNCSLLVQEEFWNFIGKNDNTYDMLIKIFERYSKRNKKKIFRGFIKLIKI